MSTIDSQASVNGGSSPLRKAIFWAHLVMGLTVGIVILTMAVTGIMIAYQRQLIARAERSVSTVIPPAGAEALRPEALAAKVAEAFPEARASGFTRRRDPAASAMVNLGRERVVFLDPYTGAVLGDGSKLRPFLHEVEHLHRDLLLAANGKKVTGTCALAFLGMVISGVYLWWPRRWTRKNLKAIAVPSLELRGKARDWNWHNAVGLWSAPLLIVSILTGLVISYPWANNLLFRLTGNEPPPRREARQEDKAKEARRGPIAIPNFDGLWAQAEQRAAGWQSITARLPESAGGPLTFIIDEGNGARPDLRSQLVLDSATGKVLRWEAYAGSNLGRQLRLWVKPIHTGEALGIVGQTLAAAGATGAVVLIWTGFSLSWRRFRSRAASLASDSPRSPLASLPVRASIPSRQPSESTFA